MTNKQKYQLIQIKLSSTNTQVLTKTNVTFSESTTQKYYNIFKKENTLEITTEQF